MAPIWKRTTVNFLLRRGERMKKVFRELATSSVLTNKGEPFLATLKTLALSLIRWKRHNQTHLITNTTAPQRLRSNKAWEPLQGHKLTHNSMELWMVLALALIHTLEEASETQINSSWQHQPIVVPLLYNLSQLKCLGLQTKINTQVSKIRWYQFESLTLFKNELEVLKFPCIATKVWLVNMAVVIVFISL